MYTIYTESYLGQAETYVCQNAQNLIFQLNYIKENRTDIDTIIIYEHEKGKGLVQRLVLEMNNGSR